MCALYRISNETSNSRTCAQRFLVEQWRGIKYISAWLYCRQIQQILSMQRRYCHWYGAIFTKREYDNDVMNSFGTVIIDESHHMAAPILHKALRHIPARYIVGLSATPNRRDGLTCLLYWSMGSICYKIERQPEHTLVSCVLYEGGKRKEIVYKDGRISMPLMLNSLVEDDNRNKIIAERMLACYKNDRYIIVLTDRIKQLEKLYVMLSNDGVLAKDMGFYIGTTKASDRAISSECRIILSTYSMAKEGLDIPRLDTLVMATPKGDIVQASGRVQRKHPEKNTPLIIDIVDTYSVFEQLDETMGILSTRRFSCQTYDMSAENAIWYT